MDNIVQIQCSNLAVIFSQPPKKERDQESFYDMDYSSLASSAKKNQEAKEILSLRIMKTVDIYAYKALSGRKYLDKDEIKSKLFDVFLEAVKIYDRKKGEFMHLLRRMFKLTIRNHLKYKALKHVRELKYFGRKVSTNDDELFNYLTSKETVNLDDEKEKIKQKVDDKLFINHLPKKEKDIISLFLLGETYKNISSLTGYPLSTVAHTIYKIRDDYQNIFS